MIGCADLETLSTPIEPLAELQFELERPVTRQLSTHPEVGPLTALAFELVIGTPERFACAKQIDRGGYRRKLYLSKSGDYTKNPPASSLRTCA